MRDREQQVVDRPNEASPAELPKECRPVRLDDILLDDLTYQLRIEARVSDLKQSLEENGQLEPVHLLGPAPHRIVDGFRRCTAAKALGWTEVRELEGLQVVEVVANERAFLHNESRKNVGVESSIAPIVRRADRTARGAPRPGRDRPRGRGCRGGGIDSECARSIRWRRAAGPGFRARGCQGSRLLGVSVLRKEER